MRLWIAGIALLIVPIWGVSTDAHAAEVVRSFNGAVSSLEKQLKLERLQITGMPTGLLVRSYASQKLEASMNNLSMHFSGDAVQFRMQDSALDSLSVDIYGLSGQRIYSAQSPSNSLAWRFRDSSGRPVSNGVYLYVVTAVDENGNTVRSGVKKLLVMR